MKAMCGIDNDQSVLRGISESVCELQLVLWASGVSSAEQESGSVASFILFFPL